MAGDDAMSQYVIIPRGEGYIAHSSVDSQAMNLPDDAEIYDDRDEFDDRLSDFEQS